MMDLAEIKERWRLSGKAVSAVDPLFVDDAMNWLIAEVGRLQEEPSDLFYKLRDENQRLTALCDGYRGEIGSRNEELAGLYIRLSGTNVHASDCATSCSPAERPSSCDCEIARGHTPLLIKQLRKASSYTEDSILGLCFEAANKIVELQSALTRARAEGMAEAVEMIDSVIAKSYGYGTTCALTAARDAIRARAARGGGGNSEA